MTTFDANLVVDVQTTDSITIMVLEFFKFTYYNLSKILKK